MNTGRSAQRTNTPYYNGMPVRQPSGGAQRRPSGSQRTPTGVQRQPSGGSQPGHKPTNSLDLARQYERDIHQIEKFLFREQDDQGRKLERYVAHVRVIEDARSPNHRPPENSPASNKKFRFLILSVKISGRMRLHKARETPDGIIQIGRTWDFEELKVMSIDTDVPTGFLFAMGKQYYWETHSPKERRVWMTTVLDNYIRYTKGRTPELINCSVEYFHLDQLLASMQPGAPQRTPIRVPTGPMGTPSAPIGTASAGTPASSGTPAPISTSASIPASNTPTRAPTQHTASPAVTRMNTHTSSISPSKRSSLFGHSRNSSTASGRHSVLSAFRRSSRRDDEFKQLEAEQQASQAALNLKQAELQRQQQDLERRQAEFEAQKRREEEERIRAEQALIEQQAAEEQRLQLEQLEKQRAEALQRHQQAQQAQQAQSQRESLSTESFHSAHSLVSSVEIVAHQKSIEEIDTVTGDAENSGDYDFLEDYAGDQTLEDLPETAPLRLSQAAPPQIQIAGDEDSLGSIEIKQQTLDTTGLPKEIQQLMQPGGELTLPEGDSQESLELARPHARSRAFSRVEDDDAKSTADFSDLFDEIGYDPVTDDYATLEKKLLRGLQRLQYDKVNTLSEVSTAGSSLQSSVSEAVDECNNIDTMLALFGVQLSSFKEDVNYIENQGHGLQVETTNKKLLAKELKDLLYSSDVPDTQLKNLVNSQITLSTRNGQLEAILELLYKSLLKMRGSDDDKLSNMKALREKRRTLEKVSEQFIANLKEDLQGIFKSMSLSLSSKLQAVDSESFKTFFRKVLVRKLSGLLTLNGMIAYVKQVSTNDYNDIVLMFTDSFADFFNNLGSKLVDIFQHEKQSLPLFNFDSPAKAIVDDAGLRTKSTAPKKKQGSNNDILRQLGLAVDEEPEEEPELASGQTSNLEPVVFSHLLHDYTDVVSMEQELVTQLFSLSSIDFESLLQVPVDKRVSEFANKGNYMDGPVETDREVSDAIFGIMKSLFSDSFNLVFKSVSAEIKDSMLELPTAVAILQDLASKTASTNQEYIYSNLIKIDARIKTLWDRQVEDQVRRIGAQSANGHVARYSKAYPIYFRKVESSFDVDNVESLEVYQQLVAVATQLWTAIVDRLGKESSSLVRLLNYKWLSDQIKEVALIPQEIKLQVDELRSKELSKFTEEFAQSHEIGEVMRFIDGVQQLAKSHTDPSTTNAYSRKTLAALLAKFEGNNLKADVHGLSQDLKVQVLDQSYDSASENKQSLQVSKALEKDLVNNCMNSLSIQYSSTFSRLNPIIKQYYSGLVNPVDKIVINYNFNKEVCT